MQLKPIWYFKKFPKGDLRLKNKDLKREALETRNESARAHYSGPDNLGPPGERGLSRDTVPSPFKVRFRKELSPRTQRCGH